MGFGAAVKSCFRNYFRLSGRASRAEYWWFTLFLVLTGIVAAVIDIIAFGPETLDSDSGGPIAVVLSLATICPSFTVLIRRMHDIGKPGYFILAPLVIAALGIGVGAVYGAILGSSAGIVVGTIICAGVVLQLYWLVRPSDSGTNKFGPHPYEGKA